jgi:uncharacterized protein (TIGR02118 family)
MIKLYALNRNPSTSEVVTPRAGVRRLTIGRSIAPFANMPPSNFDGAIECATYDDLESLLQAHRVPDLAAFLATYGSDRWIARPNVIVDGKVPDSPRVVKLTAIFKRLGTMTREKFLEYYPAVHAPLVKKTPELLRYEQNYLIGGPEADFNLRFDAVAELWWADRDTAIRSWSSPQIQLEQAQDTTNFIQAAGSISLFANEQVVW